MGLLSDAAIAARIALPDDDPNRLRISDFHPDLVKESGKPSFGTSCYGYDCRLGGEFLTMDTEALSMTAEPWVKPGKSAPWVRHFAPFFVLRPGGFVLARTMEYVRVPRDCGGVVFGKSTWARHAICLNTTLLEPEWEGTVTLEISNIGNFCVCLEAGAGICQIVFQTADGAQPIRTSYADRASPTYQYQREVTAAKV